MNSLIDPSLDTINVDWNSEMFTMDDTVDLVNYDAVEMRPSGTDNPPNPSSSSTSSDMLRDIEKAVPPQNSPSEAVLQALNDVSGKLYTHSINFPRRRPSSSPDGSSLHINATPEEYQYFDLTLMLTNSMIELYPRFTVDVLQFPLKPSCSQNMSIVSPSIVSDIQAPKLLPQLDYPSILQINACHQRLASCWDDMLNQMENCTAHMLNEMLKDGGEPSLDHIPVVQIGNYTPSRSQVMSMQQTLLLQLLTQLWEMSSDLVATVQKYLEVQKTSHGPTAIDTMAGLTESICLETQTRANANITKLRSLKKLWENRGLVYGVKLDL